MIAVKVLVWAALFLPVGRRFHVLVTAQAGVNGFDDPGPLVGAQGRYRADSLGDVMDQALSNEFGPQSGKSRIMRAVVTFDVRDGA
jgi:hypothetical protein